MGKVQQHKRSAKEKRQEVVKPDSAAVQQDRFDIYGEVEQCLPNTMFKIRVTDSEVAELVGKELLGTLSGKMRLYRIRVMPGDLIKAYVSKYDLGKCKITYRSTKKEIKKDL
ncbi:MAG: Translation initiation factor IF-1 [Microgenomates bacterium 39_7]|nr:MAG: Translation initiation factor IF-1 [Microgenomates bacterium 39_7]